MTFRRKAAIVVISWMILVPVAILAPSTQASAAVEHGAGDSSTFGERLSDDDGFDANHAGLRVRFSAAAADDGEEQHELCAIVPDSLGCTGGSGGSGGSGGGSPPPPPPPPPQLSTAQLRAQAYPVALAELKANMPTPDMQLWPSEGQHQIVNLDSFLYVRSGWTNAPSGSFTAVDPNYPSNSVRVEMNAVPEDSVWEFTEANGINPPVTETCKQGQKWTPGNDSPKCGKSWTNSSDVIGTVEVEMFIRYRVEVFSDFFPREEFTLLSDNPDTATLTVAEVQTFGNSTIDPVAEDSGGGLCSKWGISFVCWVGSKAKDAAIWALVNAVPGLEEVWNFFKGCGDAVLDELGGILDILNTIKDAILDPEAFINDQLQTVKDLYEAATSDPEGFVVEVLGGILETDYIDEHGYIQWIGKKACEFAIQYLSGSAVASLTKKLDDFIKRRRNDDGSSCTRNSSFPGNTQVLMADGGYVPIDSIEPGDHVLSHNLDTSVWEPKLVLDQWSHHDRGPPATLTLIDGSSVTATDDHLFWVTNTEAWTQLQHVDDGDTVLTPAGDITVDYVTVGPAHPWTVWELTVEGNHNFTVSTDTFDILVHNCGDDDDDCTTCTPGADREPKKDGNNYDDGPPVNGDEDFNVYDPEDKGRTITDVDEVRDGAFVEKKDLEVVPLDPDGWIKKHITDKAAKLKEAASVLPGFENAPIIFELGGTGADPALRSLIEAAAADVGATVIWVNPAP